jgi:hypothetical protein
LRTKVEKVVKMRIVIIAACAGMLALAQIAYTESAASKTVSTPSKIGASHKEKVVIHHEGRIHGLRLEGGDGGVFGRHGSFHPDKHGAF